MGAEIATLTQRFERSRAVAGVLTAQVCAPAQTVRAA